MFKGTVSHCYCWTVIDVHSPLGEVPTQKYDQQPLIKQYWLMLLYESVASSPGSLPITFISLVPRLSPPPRFLRREPGNEANESDGLALCKCSVATTWHATNEYLPEATLFNDHICDILKANDYWACVKVNPTDHSLLCVSKQEYVLWNKGAVSGIS